MCLCVCVCAHAHLCVRVDVLRGKRKIIMIKSFFALRVCDVGGGQQQKSPPAAVGRHFQAGWGREACCHEWLSEGRVSQAGDGATLRADLQGDGERGGEGLPIVYMYYIYYGIYYRE